MQFQVRVETRRQGQPLVGDVFVVEALNEMTAASLAQLKARDKYPGGMPIVRGAVLPADADFEMKPRSFGPKAEEKPAKTVVHAATKDKTVGLRDYDQPQPKTYAEWKKMPWFTLRKYATHAARDTAPAPTNKTEAMMILQDRGLVKP